MLSAASLLDGDSLIVGNQSSIEQDTARAALLKVDVGSPVTRSSCRPRLRFRFGYDCG